MGQQAGEFTELRLIGQGAEQKQVGDFFEAETVFLDKAAYDFLDVHAAIIELALAGDFFTVYNLLGANLGNLGKPRQHAFSV